MAKTPHPPDGGYVPLTAAIDERDCRENQRTCRAEVDGIFQRVFDAINGKVSWPILSILITISILLMGALWVRSDVNQRGIAAQERTIETAKGESLRLAEVIARVEKALDRQIVAFDALCAELKAGGK